MKDLGATNYLANKAAGDHLYPEMLYQYSTKAERKPLKMVKGEFIGPATSSVPLTSSTPGTSASASSTAGKPSLVQVENYIFKQQPCFMWIRNGVQETSYRSEWEKFSLGGKPGLLHKAKNLISRML